MSKTPKMFVFVLAMLVLAAPSFLQAQDGQIEAEAETVATVLDTVVVTSSRMEESLRTVPVNTTVISEDEIKKSNAVSLDKLLERKGLYVVNNGPNKLLKIRGMGQNSMSSEMESNLLILLNGRRIGANSVASLSLDNVERVEIIRGPSAVQYGSSAMGGVVNVISKRGQEGRPQAAVEFGVGSFGLNREKLAFSGAAEGFDFSAGLTHYSQKDYDVSGGHKWQHTGIASSTAMNFDLGYSFLEELHRFGVGLYYFDQNDGQFPNYGWIGSNGEKGPFTGYNNYDLETYNLAFQYEGKSADDKFNWFARYAFGKDFKDGSFYDAVWGDSWQDENMDTKTATAQLDYKGELISTAVGLDYVNYEFAKKSGTMDQSSIHENLGAYISAKLHLLDERLILSAGGRYDHFKLDGNHVLPTGGKMKTSRDNNFAPSVGASFFPVDWLKLRANYSEGFKMPSPTQLGGGTVGFYLYHPSPGLKPEQSKTFEFGLDAAGEFWNAGVTYFHTDWDNKISSVLHASGNGYVARNINAALIEGLELDLSVDLGQAFEREYVLRPYASMSYYLSRDNKDGNMVRNSGVKNLYDLPKYTVTYGLDFVHPEYDFSANINAVYHGEQDATFWDNSAFATKYVKHTSGTVVDLSLEKGIVDFDEHGQLKVKLDVNNLFDGDNDSYYDYLGPGRNFYVGLRYEFK